jgi:pimeloyl-ACP methyl ester carboxylesterase
MTTAVEPREHTTEARGLRFHYVEWGDPDAPPVLLLHGMSSTCRIWDPFARAFQDQYRLLALDQRGHAETSWPEAPAYSTGDYVADIEAFVEQQRIDKFVLIGLSMGAHSSMAYAAKHPEKVTHLVPVDIRPGFDYERRPSLGADRYTAEHGHPAFASHEAALATARLTNQTTPDSVLRHRLRHILTELPDGRWTFKHDPRVGFYWKPADLWPELSKISAPALFVRGGKSQYVSQAAAERTRDAFPNGELITIEDAGHTVPEDTADEFIEAVRSFLERHPA